MPNFNALPPSPSCVICGNALEYIGGRRITAQKARGIAISNFGWTLHDRSNLQFCEPLLKDEEIYLVIWSDEKVWTPDVINRIMSCYMDGMRPWYCQGKGCGYRQCRVCGKAENLPCASDLLYDDGRNPHLMVIPADLGCTNQLCRNYREMDEGWEIVQVNAQVA